MGTTELKHDDFLTAPMLTGYIVQYNLMNLLSTVLQIANIYNCYGYWQRPCLTERNIALMGVRGYSPDQSTIEN